MKPLDQCRLYAFVDTAYLAGRPPAAVAKALCDGGVDLIQLRAKTSTPGEFRELALELQPITRAAGVGLVINDHLEIAREVGAELCHLGQEDFFDAGHTHVSQILQPGESLRIGLSTHSPAQAQRAVNAGAAYVAIGPVFPTPTKPTAQAVTLEYVRWAAANVSIPWFAIGGINESNLDSVLQAGAKRICVVSAILNAMDMAKVCRRFRDHLPGSQSATLVS